MSHVSIFFTSKLNPNKGFLLHKNKKKMRGVLEIVPSVFVVLCQEILETLLNSKKHHHQLF